MLFRNYGYGYKLHHWAGYHYNCGDICRPNILQLNGTGQLQDVEMSIASITEITWPEILEVQAGAYSPVYTESLGVLKSKWQRSPETCFVYKDGEKVLGYLLAHSWNSEEPPKLFQNLPTGTEGPILFIHDLAISSRALKKGLGSKMIEHLFQVTDPLGYQQARLVSVQKSNLFWQKQGFLVLPDPDVCPSYGPGAKLMRYDF